MTTRSPAFNRVLYVTSASTDRWFQPVNTDEHGGGDGDMADQLGECQNLVGTDTGHSNRQIGKAVQAGTLADW